MRESNFFDLVITQEVLEHVKSPRLAIKEIFRVLKPNGKLIIADWGKASNKLMRFTFGFVQLLDGFKTTNDNVKGLMPTFIKNANFFNVEITKSINTIIGTFSYCTATK